MLADFRVFEPRWTLFLRSLKVRERELATLDETRRPGES